LLAAECTERGSRLLGVQHGGVYGLGKAVAGEVLERAITDRWYAWGWAELASDPKVRNLPNPGLSALAGTTPNVRADQILYVSTDFPISMNRLHNSPIENQYEEYFTWRLKFIGALSEPVRERLFVRLYPIDFGWTQSQRLKAAIPDVGLDDFTQGFEGRLSQARLAVFDHPGTTFLQGMVSGIPCVLFWKPSHWEMRDSARLYLDRLRDAGILFDDPVGAAGQVLRVWKEPDRWWGSAQVRNAREAFVERFALARPDWLKVWVRELTAEAVLSRVRPAGVKAHEKGAT
jgi:putative transferase (TIGR04331 family)